MSAAAANLALLPVLASRSLYSSTAGPTSSTGWLTRRGGLKRGRRSVQSRWIAWLILTKRPQNIRRMLPSDWGDGYPNVWLGVTAEDQREARRRLPMLLRVPCKRHYASVEPMLAMDLTEWLDSRSPVLVICGRETKMPEPRPLDPDWGHDLRHNALPPGLIFFMKQLHGHNQTDAKARLPVDLRGITERPSLWS